MLRPWVHQVGTTLGNAIRFTVAILIQTFGSVKWTPPSWISKVYQILPVKAVVSFVARITHATISHITAHIRIYKWTALASVLLIIAGSSGYIWYLMQPKPVEFTVSGSTPRPTPLIENAVIEPVHVYFNGSAAHLEQIGKPITQDISIAPAIQGDWTWVNDHEIVFRPSEDWKIGEDYKIKLDKKLFPAHVRLNRYEYEFRTAEFNATLRQSEFYQDPKNPKIKKVVTTLSFTHPVDSSDFEKRITLHMADEKTGLFGLGDKTIPFTVSYDKFKGEAYIHSDNLPIPPKDRQLVVTIDSGVRAARGGPKLSNALKTSVTIPGMFNYFRIQNAGLTLVRNERYEPEQVLVMQMTGGVLESELQKHMSVYLLPKDKPAMQDIPVQHNYQYYNVKEIGPEILSQASKLPLTPIPTDKEYANLHSFKYKADVGRYIYIKLDKGIESYGGYYLANAYDQILNVPDFPKELQIMYDGALLSLHGEKKLSMLSRDIEAVSFSIERVLPSQINHLITQSGGHFKSPQFSNYNFSFENITEHFSQVRDLKQMDHGKTQYFSFDLSTYLGNESGGGTKRGLFFFRVGGVDRANHNSVGIEDSRLVLVTNLGMVVKDNADGSHDVYVQSIHNGQPVAGAQIQVLGKNGIAIASVVTDPNGHVNLPSLADFKREKTPTVYIAKRGDDMSFMPFDRSDRQLNFSRFDTGGEITANTEDKLNAFLFSDRGIYRPGDTIHIGAMLKTGDWQQQLAGIPLEMVFTDARGIEVQQQKTKLSESGFEEMSYRTEETSPTGQYQASVYLIRDKSRAELLGATTVRVEEFLPDRLKITTRISQERLEGWVSPNDLKGNVNLKNLFGTAAINRRVAASISLSPAYPAFRDYKEYSFYDPLKSRQSINERLPDQTTDDDGAASFDFKLERFDKATYRVGFTAEGYEAEGGRSVTSNSSVLVSPLAYLVGYKTDGNLQYINKGSARGVEFIAVGPALQKIAVKGLKARVQELRYVSVLTQQPNGTYKYESIRKEIPLSKEEFNIAVAGSSFNLPTNQPGDYQLIVTGDDDIELNRVNFSIAGAANLTRNLEKNAELQIKLSKTDYSPGEEIELEIKAPYTGSGLITIERDRVYQHKWFTTKTNSSIQRIRLPAELEGNGYVNVTFLRSMDSPEVFMSPLSYGIAPFFISREKHTIPIKLTTPDLARPGERFRIRYSSKQAGKIVIFAVDEGILQVANYQTPDPLGHYFKKRALEVRTAQILDLILPEFKLIQELSAPGGDQEGLEAIGKNLNPFKRKRDKAVVFWSGIIDTDAKERELTYEVPDYFNGTLRVMAVAVSSKALGVAEKKSLVRGHFVLSPNAPTTVSPGDEFDVSIGVANNVEGSGNEPIIQLELATSTQLEVIGNSKQTLKVAEGKESSVKYRLRATNRLGSGNMKFIASMADKRSKASVDLSVRPAVPFMATVSTGIVQSNKVSIDVPRRMYPHYRTNDVNASALPLSLAHGLITYLDTYPHVCTEQLVSRAFPAIVLRNRPDFGYAPDRVEATLAQTMRILRARQTPEGSFGFWAANSHVSDIQSVYALHFLTEAKERGYSSGDVILNRGMEYLKVRAQHNVHNISEARVSAYAIYLLTRNGIVTTNQLNSLRSQLDAKELNGWQKDLTAAYLAATYKLLKNDSAANKLIDKLSLTEMQRNDYFYLYDSLVYDSQLLYILAKHFPDRAKSVDGKTFQAMIQPVSSGNYNTISSAYLILGLDSYIDVVGASQLTGKITVAEMLPESKSQPLVLPSGLFPHIGFSEKAEKIRIDNPNNFPVYYQITQSGFDLAIPDKPIKQQLEVQREYRDLSGKVITEIPLGEEIEVHLKLRSVEKGGLSNIAVVDLLPGGFEVVMNQTTLLQATESLVIDPSPEELDNADPESEQSVDEDVPAIPTDSNISPPTSSQNKWQSPLTSSRSTWYPEYVDIREDRVVIYGTVTPDAQEYVYRIKATNVGKYATPPVYGEGMYDRKVQARGISAKMTVTDNK